MPLPLWLPTLPSLPSLPAVPLPANLQHRLVAFLLRRALGAFVKQDSGWGDRVQADIGRGRVKVTQLDVDPQAINSFLSPSSSPSDPDDLSPPRSSASPIEFVSGTLSSVSALITYPSLSLGTLASGGGDAKLDLEVEGVELVFRVRTPLPATADDLSASTSTTAASPPTRPGQGRARTLSTTSDASSTSSTSSFSSQSSSPSLDTHRHYPHPLTESTLSLAVAHEFLSAVSPAEELFLRESLHLPPPSISASVDLPGAFGGARSSPTEEQPQKEGKQPQLNPKEEEVEEVEAGLLAGVVERILARLSVKVKDVRVRLLWDVEGGEGEGRANELSLRVEEILYRGADESAGGGRSVAVSPPRVYLLTPPPPSLYSSFPSPPSPSALSRGPAAPPSPSRSSSSSSSSDDSSGDDSDFLAMSQSIADLRTSTSSLNSLHASSAAGSRMFASARSFAEPIGEEEEEEEEREEKEVARDEDDPFSSIPPDDDGDGDGTFETPQGSPAQKDGTPLPLPHSSSPHSSSSPPNLSPPSQANDDPNESLILSFGPSHPSASPLIFHLSPTSPSSVPTLSANLEGRWVVAVTAEQVGVLLGLAERLAEGGKKEEGGDEEEKEKTSKGGVGVKVDVKLAGVEVYISYPLSSPPSFSSLMEKEAETAPSPFDAAFWASFSPPSSASPVVTAPHLHLQLFAISLSSLRSSGFELSIASVLLAETSLTLSSSSTSSSSYRTLPVLVSDPHLPLTLLKDGSAEAEDWVREGKRFDGEGRFAGGRKRRKEEGEAKPAVRVRLGKEGGGREVALSPFHLYLDLTLLNRLQPLLDIFASASSTSSPPPPRASTPTAQAQHLFPLARPPSPPLFSSPPTPSTTLTCPLFRLSTRPPPLTSSSTNELRSGRILIDFTSLSLSHSPSSPSPTTTATVSSLTLRFAPLSAPRATLLADLAPLVPLSEDATAALPSLSFCGKEVEVVIPLVRVRLGKRELDGVQLWTDDVGKWAASLAPAAPPPLRAENAPAEKSRRDGRRERERMEDSTATVVPPQGDEEEEEGDRTLGVRVAVTDVVVDLFLDPLPSSPSSSPSSSSSDDSSNDTTAQNQKERRHLRALVSDVGAEIEVFKGGKDDLRARISVMDLSLEDVALTNGGGKILSRTLPRNLISPLPPSPVLSLIFVSSANALTTRKKESSFTVDVENVTAVVEGGDWEWLGELAVFGKAPEGAFEDTLPSDLTTLRLSLSSSSLHLTAPHLPSQAVLSVSLLTLSTSLTPDAPRTELLAGVEGLRVWAVDSAEDLVAEGGGVVGARDEREWWKRRGFVEIAVVERARVSAGLATSGGRGPEVELAIDDAKVDVALCADTMASIGKFVEDLQTGVSFQSKPAKVPSPRPTSRRKPARRTPADLLASVDPAAFEQAPPLQDYPEILDDDVPTNLDYLADALNQTLRRPKPHGRGGSSSSQAQGVLISEVDGETIRMLRPKGIEIVDEWLSESRVDAKDVNLPPIKFRCRLKNAFVSVHIHEGYDWFTTRKAIEEEAKAIRRRLEKIRQLLSTGQTPDASAAEKSASTLMFGSLQLGLPPGASELPPKDLLAAINEELDDAASVANSDAVSTTSSWQTFPGGGGGDAPSSTSRRPPAPAVVGKARKKLTRSRTFAIEINLRSLSASFDTFSPSPSLDPSMSMYTSLLLPSSRSQLASKLAVDVGSFDIIDNIKTSTWRKFLTELRANDGGVVRATGAPMAKVEVSTVRPVGGVKDAREEVLLKIKISPLRLYIDQDALDFLKAFGAFELPAAATKAAPAPSSEPFFQRVEVFPVKIKLDYKPKRVDYNALRNGKTAELMNFFHFDGSEMTLRHLVVTGISGATTLSSLVQDIWTPDVKAHQLADVISGIAPVRSVVSVGSGVANLVLLPIEQYRKDGRVVRGLQKGAQAFARQTTLEAINVGAKLANGTQVILEQAEHVLGARFSGPLSAEALPPSPTSAAGSSPFTAQEEPTSDDDRHEVRSRYASQPANVKQGVESAYKSLGENFKEAAQTILAVPMEVYERSGTEGPVRAVVRAVPIAVLKPMIGASGAVSKALLGLRNSLDPDGQEGELEDKYKREVRRRGGR